MRSFCGWTFASPRFGLRCQKIVVNFVIESFDTWNQKNFPRLNEQHFIDWIFHINIIKIVIRLFNFLGINFALLFEMSWFLWLVLLYLLFEIVNKIRLDHLANNLLKINCRWHRYELSYSDTDLLLCFRIPMPDQIPLTFGMKYLPKKKLPLETVFNAINAISPSAAPEIFQQCPRTFGYFVWKSYLV